MPHESSPDRAERELRLLERLSHTLGDGLELEDVFQHAMSLLGEELGVMRSSLVLIDPISDTLRVVASTGLTPREQERGQYARGEGINGHVLLTGESAVIPDVSADDRFLNRTGARDLDGGGKVVSFICVPVRSGDEVLGAISVDKPFESTDQLEADVRLLRIIAGSFTQASRTHDLVARQRAVWEQETRRLHADLNQRYQFDNIIGDSEPMLEVLSTVAQVASSRATVLILGETGCGKELIARALHYNSPRKEKPLIRVNCGALSPQLLESELFGHVQGAFTGAVRDKIGRFEAADGGTIFLDEIGTMDPQMQVKLLRVLQERELERVGDHRTVKVDCRVIAATNLNLEEEARHGAFREDLFYRLNVVSLNIPPLRTRRQDIPRLIEHFLDRYNEENAKSVRNITPSVMNTLLRYPWPGNVRELENAMERAVVLATTEALTDDLLPLQIRMYTTQTRQRNIAQTLPELAQRVAREAARLYGEDMLPEGGKGGSGGQVWSEAIQAIERELLREALDANDGIKLRAAEWLGINRNTLNKKFKEFDLDGR